MIELSQSIIKEVLKYGLCPRKFKAYYLDNQYHNEPGMAMFRGIYFEYKLLGNLPKEGTVPVYPKGKRGKYEIHKSRIDEQIKAFPKIAKEHGIEVLCGTQVVKWKYTDYITFSITLDSLLLYKKRLYVGDFKLSLDLNSNFGPVAWGDFNNMDKLQAHLYSYVMSKVLGEKVGFIYLVFDYKKSKREYKILEVETGKEEMDNMFDRILLAERKLRWMERVDYRPSAFADTCKSCQVQNCIARIEPKGKKEPKKEKVPEKQVSVSIDELLNIINA